MSTPSSPICPACGTATVARRIGRKMGWVCLDAACPVDYLLHSRIPPPEPTATPSAILEFDAGMNREAARRAADNLQRGGDHKHTCRGALSRLRDREKSWNLACAGLIYRQAHGYNI